MEGGPKGCRKVECSGNGGNRLGAEEGLALEIRGEFVVWGFFQGGGAEKKFPQEVKIFFQPRHLSPPNPVYKNFYPRGTFSTLTPHCPHWAHTPPPLEPPPTPPHPPCSAASKEILWRLPRLPWPGVANHMPPILGPTHGAPGSKHNNTSCRMQVHMYMYRSTLIC